MKNEMRRMVTNFDRKGTSKAENSYRKQLHNYALYFEIIVLEKKLKEESIT